MPALCSAGEVSHDLGSQGCPQQFRVNCNLRDSYEPVVSESVNEIPGRFFVLEDDEDLLLVKVSLECCFR